MRRARVKNQEKKKKKMMRKLKWRSYSETEKLDKETRNEYPSSSVGRLRMRGVTKRQLCDDTIIVLI